MPGQPSERRALSAVYQEIPLRGQAHVYAEVAMSAADTSPSLPPLLLLLSPCSAEAMRQATTQPSAPVPSSDDTVYIVMHRGMYSSTVRRCSTVVWRRQNKALQAKSCAEEWVGGSTGGLQATYGCVHLLSLRGGSTDPRCYKHLLPLCGLQASDASRSPPCRGAKFKFQIFRDPGMQVCLDRMLRAGMRG